MTEQPNDAPEQEPDPLWWSEMDGWAMSGTAAEELSNVRIDRISAVVQRGKTLWVSLQGTQAPLVQSYDTELLAGQAMGQLLGIIDDEAT